MGLVDLAGLAVEAAASARDADSDAGSTCTAGARYADGVTSQLRSMRAWFR